MSSVSQVKAEWHRNATGSRSLLMFYRKCDWWCHLFASKNICNQTRKSGWALA